MEKLSAILLSTLLLAPSPALAFPYGRTSGTFEQCNRNRYTERYIPGYYNKHGQYVGGYVKTDSVKVPCNNFASLMPNQGGGNSAAVTSIVLPLLVNLLQNR
jgi:hypothetical protein